MDWNPKQKINGISIQVCLNGYSFKVEDDGAVTESGWRGADTVFTAPEFQRRYRHVEVSLFTPKVALVPRTFFDESTARQDIAETAREIQRYHRLTLSSQVDGSYRIEGAVIDQRLCLLHGLRRALRLCPHFIAHHFTPALKTQLKLQGIARKIGRAHV